jgi:hypothetical protein
VTGAGNVGCKFVVTERISFVFMCSFLSPESLPTPTLAPLEDPTPVSSRDFHFAPTHIFIHINIETLVGIRSLADCKTEL